jgi:hypothetical protein
MTTAPARTWIDDHRRDRDAPTKLQALRGFVMSSVLAMGSLKCVPMFEAVATSLPSGEPGSLAPIGEGALESEVVQVRHLPPVHPIDVRVLTDDDFRGYMASQARLGPMASGARTAFWQTVGGGALDRSPGETERRVLEAEVVGLYDRRAKSLFVRGSTNWASDLKLGK